MILVKSQSNHNMRYVGFNQCGDVNHIQLEIVSGFNLKTLCEYSLMPEKYMLATKMLTNFRILLLSRQPELAVSSDVRCFIDKQHWLRYSVLKYVDHKLSI